MNNRAHKRALYKRRAIQTSKAYDTFWSSWEVACAKSKVTPVPATFSGLLPLCGPHHFAEFPKTLQLFDNRMDGHRNVGTVTNLRLEGGRVIGNFKIHDQEVVKEISGPGYSYSMGAQHVAVVNKD